jgi:hypothetical protein
MLQYEIYSITAMTDMILLATDELDGDNTCSLLIKQLANFFPLHIHCMVGIKIPFYS